VVLFRLKHHFCGLVLAEREVEDMKKMIMKFGSPMCVAMLVLVGLAFSMIIVSQNASAGTAVSGSITSDTWWTQAGSPYWVEGNVIVTNSATLYIDTSVDVLFNGYFSIYVEVGGMVVVKQAAGPRPYALFSSNKTVKAIGDWHAIQLNDSSFDTSLISDSVIEYATYGIYLDNASPKIANNTIRYCTHAIRGYYASPLISNNNITSHVQSGIYIEGNDPKRSSSRRYARIENNQIDHSGSTAIGLDSVTEFAVVNNTNIWNMYSIFLSESDNNTIINNTVDGAWYGMFIEYSDNNTIDNNYVTYNQGPAAIRLEYSSNNSLTGNNVSDNHLSSGISLGASSNTTITNNTILSNGDEGILLALSMNNTVLNNTMNDNDMGLWSISSRYNYIINNTMLDNYQGIYVKDSRVTNITDNNISSNIYNGIWLLDSDYINITNNNISSNSRDGIYLDDSTYINISYNNISSNSYNGIFMTDGTSNDVYDNTIGWNSIAGINCTSDSVAAITYNDIDKNTWHGVWSEDGADPLVNYNNIRDNGGGSGGLGWGMKNVDSTIEIDGQNNYWNAADGPGGVGPGSGDKVSLWVDYDPFSSVPI
jgi:parallel beta-helix repeat protein